MNDLSLQDARILIVDDQEANVLFLEGLLQEGGYRRYLSLRDPRAVVEVYDEFRPDLILLDLLMPELDGFGVLEELQPQLAEELYLPVLVLTVDPTPESKRRALAAGVKDFLTKPLDAVEVLLRVKNLLETRFLYLRLQQRADERIREQAALIDQASDAILVCDLADRITFWSRGAEALYGWAAAETTGRAVGELLSPARPDGLEVASRAVVATGAWSGELTQVTRDGREVLVSSRWTLLRDAAGRPRSKLVLNTDITERKKTEEKLLRAQGLENIGRLAGGIAHDLNNILAPLTMGADLLGRSYTDPSSQALLTTMQASIQRGTDLVRQILSFSRGLDTERHPVQLAALIGELSRLFQQTFPRSITLHTSVPETLWLVHADGTQLHQVLTNLCVNARDAMPHGGQLRITASNRWLDEAEARQTQGLPPGRYVVLEVEDTGTGIAPEVLGRVFDPFFTTKEHGKGTGLGLSTAQGIVRNHGGRIGVESQVGRGTRFAVYLPACEATATGGPAPEPRELPGGQGELLLVIDDEEALRHIAQLTLSAAGYQVVTAQHGAEAVALYARRPREFRAVLTDLMMPVMDGSATVVALERLNPDVRVIVFSGLLSGAETAQSFGPVVKAFLPKPYSVEALLTTLRSVLDS